ncbi:hypothetical protein D3C77_28450 [compost metagenome]
MTLTFKTDGLAFIDVPAPYFGQDVVIRVNKRAVKHYIRSSELSTKIAERKDIAEQDKIAYHVAAGLMSICTIPSTGEFAFADDQVDDLVNLLPKELYEELAVAAFSLDPISAEQPKTLIAKKKKS